MASSVTVAALSVTMMLVNMSLLYTNVPAVISAAKTEKTDQANPEAVPGEGAHTKVDAPSHNKDDTQTTFLGRMGKAVYAIPDVVFNQIPESSILGTVQSKTRAMQKEVDELNRKKNEHKEENVNQD